MKHIGLSYEDLMIIPTYERRYYLNLLTGDIEKQNEAYENQINSASNSGKGTRSQSISGNALKHKMKNEK